MNRPIPTDEELARYLADELSAPDRARIDAWANETESHRAELDRLRAAWQSPTSSNRWNVDRAWSQVDARLDTGARVIPLERAKAWHQHAAWRVAAAIVLVVGASYWWRLQSPSASSASDQLFVTAIGEVKDVQLADSTRVTLGPSSRLTVPGAYGHGQRDVSLVGEAVFIVRHDSARVFSVRAAHTITRDIGTVFTIRAIDRDTVVRVSVQEGSASLRSVDAPIDGAAVLRAHDVGVLTVGNPTVRTERESGSGATWRTGQLVFDAASLSDVVRELQRWYVVTVMPLDSAMASRRVSATLPARDLREALDILRLAMRIDIAQRGDTLTFR
jgi:transmembrane sensor